MSKPVDRSGSLPAKLLLLGSKPLACSVTEVSSSGIRLRLDQADHLSRNEFPFGVQSGAPVSLVLEEKSTKPWQVSALLMHRRQQEVELSYPGAPPPESNRLARLLSEQRSGHIDTAGTLDLLERCAEKHAKQVYEDFLARIDEMIFLKAKDALRFQDQMEYTGLRTRFRQLRADTSARYIDTIRTQIRSLDTAGGNAATNDQASLSLVSHDNLAGLLDDKELISNIYETAGGQIEKIKQRFGELVGAEVPEAVIPVSPEFLCSSFRKSLAGIEIPIRVLHELHQIYQQVLLSTVNPLYEEFNAILKEAGVLPDLEISNRQAMMLRQKRSQVVNLAAAQALKQEAGKAEDAKRPPENPVTENRHDSPDNIYRTVRNLMGINKKNQQARESLFAMNAPSGDELISIIDAIRDSEEYQVSENTNGGVKAAIKDHLSWSSDNTRPLSISHDDCLDLYESMFDAIVNGNEIEPTFREKILRLKTPFLKRVLVDESFFSSRHNPARVLLNQFSFLSSFAHNLNNKTIARLDEIVEDIIQGSPFDTDVLGGMSDEIQKLLDRQEELRKRHISRIISTHEATEKLALANHEIDRTLKLYATEDGRLPAPVCELLNLGLRQYLLLTWINHGSGSERWRVAVEELRTVLGWLQPAPDATVFYQRLAGYENTQILDIINHLSEYIDSVNPGLNEHSRLVSRLAVALLDRQFDASLMELADLSVVRDYAGSDANETSVDARDLRLLNHLVRNDWIARPDASLRESLQVVWFNHNRSQFVLADRLGHEHSTLQASQMAKLFCEGWQINKDQSAQGAVDRGIYTTLQRVYQQLTYQRSHDELTGLANRKEFERGLEQLLEQKTAVETDYFMLAMDLDQFALINNLCGHHAGDKLLQELAELFVATLSGCTRLVARIGANEFAAILQNRTEAECLELAESVRQSVVSHPFAVAGHPYQVTASFGLARFDLQTGSASSVFRRATGACSMAKEAGRNRIMNYREDDNAVRRRQTLEEWYPKINEAVQNNDLYLKVQRIEPNSAASGEMPHYEVLLGLNDQENKPIPIWQFIQAAEYYKKMQEVDRWVINATFDWINRNLDKMAVMDCISINLSGTTIGDENFLEFLVQKLNTVKVDKRRICFEITETSAILSLEKAIMFITEIRNLGCQFSLDDFGTGFASYEYLKRLPVDYLKIDGVFIKNLAQNSEDMAVVNSICEIGHYMNKKIVAEFVETREIWEMLKTAGVDYVQGFGIEMPKLISQL